MKLKNKLLSFVSALIPINSALWSNPERYPRALSGQASFYDSSYIGKTMANGQTYNPYAFTLACNDLPLGTVVYINYTSRSGNKRFAHATVTDRGPAERLRARGRIFDLSYGLFKHLENPGMGVITINVEVLP